MKSLLPESVRLTPAWLVAETVLFFVPLGVAPESRAMLPRLDEASQINPFDPVPSEVPDEIVMLVCPLTELRQ